MRSVPQVTVVDIWHGRAMLGRGPRLGAVGSGRVACPRTMSRRNRAGEATLARSRCCIGRSRGRSGAGTVARPRPATLCRRNWARNGIVARLPRSIDRTGICKEAPRAREI